MKEHVCDGTDYTCRLERDRYQGWRIVVRCDSPNYYGKTVIPGVRVCPFCGEVLANG